ncbi:MAG TPA: hypothetical protein VFH38_06655 [Jatrophihabitans sp.]|nr:hypothetical protein [Jatrophihabitans sp.]
MTGDVVTWLVATWQLLTAVGIAVFWATWFRQPHTASWQPRGYVEHERVFVYPDSILATLLVVSAALLLAEQPVGQTLALVCAGMLAFLGVIDAAYYAQHGMYARERDGLLNAFLVVAVLALAVVLGVRYA